MSVEREHPAAFERAAKSVHEAFNGKGSWRSADKDQRSAARQAMRRLIKSLEGDGFLITFAGAAADPETTPEVVRTEPETTPEVVRTEPDKPRTAFVLPPRRQ